MQVICQCSNNEHVRYNQTKAVACVIERRQLIGKNVENNQRWSNTEHCLLPPIFDRLDYTKNSMINARTKDHRKLEQ